MTVGKKAQHTTRQRAKPHAWLILQGCLLAVLSASPELASAENLRPLRVPIELEQVIAALRASKLPLESAEVRLLAQNVATTAQPALEVRGVEPWGDQGARVRLGCSAHEQCLPFYVAVEWADAALAKAALHGSIVPASRQSAASVSSRHVAEASPATFKAKPATFQSERLRPQPLIATAATESTPDGSADESSVRAGAHVTLLIDADRLHIRVPVVCLEKGAPGSKIRVAALDHRQTYVAEVVDSTLLKGTL